MPVRLLAGHDLWKQDVVNLGRRWHVSAYASSLNVQQILVVGTSGALWFLGVFGGTRVFPGVAGFIATTGNLTSQEVVDLADIIHIAAHCVSAGEVQRTIAGLGASID